MNDEKATHQSIAEVSINSDKVKLEWPKSRGTTSSQLLQMYAEAEAQTELKNER